MERLSTPDANAKLAPSHRSLFLRRLTQSKLFMIGAAGACFVILACLFSAWLAPYGPTQVDLKARLAPPVWLIDGPGNHLFGADQLGRDLLSRVLVGGRYSLSVALGVVAGGTIIGVVLGILAGYLGGIVDKIIMRLVDIMMTLPTLIVALCFVAVLGASLQNLVLVLCLTSWVLTARVVRGSTLAVKSSDFVSAARVMGASSREIMWRDVLPNIIPPILIMATQQIGIILLTEAGMSFLGMGIPAPTPSWGGMIADGQSYIAVAPWLVIVPGMALMLAVLAFNMLGDGLRDVLDPRNTH